MKYFITATDTGVGKTYVTASLIRFYKSKNYKVKAIKPIETGCVKKGKNLIPEDASLYANLTGQSLDEVCLYKFTTPVSPYTASKLEKREIDIDKIKTHVNTVYEKLVKNYKDKAVLFIEGAGGLMVPITKSFMMIDFPLLLNAPVILVSSLRLGTINHTLLSIEALERRNIPIKGIILNNALGLNTIAESTNESILQELINIPILYVLRRDEQISQINL
jgi:dethiobiotin synthetase